MRWLQAIFRQAPSHKYAINAALLGDPAELPWSNLGYWHSSAQDYPAACQQLADHLAEAVQLQSTDRLLDLGCGQGASLLHWQQHYQLSNITAVELQTTCVEQIQARWPELPIYAQSFLNLKNLIPLAPFDVVLCIDAAYHHALNSFLDAVQPVLNSKGRLGFHTLILPPQFLNSNTVQQHAYRALLKAADVSLPELKTAVQLEQCLQERGFTQIQIEDLSAPVLNGFAEYIQQLHWPQHSPGLDRIKIAMTAKLCRRLYKDGLVRYVQVTAHTQ